ncbi:hypothetical protein M5D96_002544, partial [Drosophila gunungcola]
MVNNFTEFVSDYPMDRCNKRHTHRKHFGKQSDQRNFKTNLFSQRSVPYFFRRHWWKLNWSSYILRGLVEVSTENGKGNMTFNEFFCTWYLHRQSNLHIAQHEY